MKTTQGDWAGYLAKPPRLRPKTGATSGSMLAQPTAREPRLARERLVKWISRRSNGKLAAKKSGPQRKTDERDTVIVVPSVHGLARATPSELSSELLASWLSVIAYGKKVRGRDDQAIHTFEAAALAQKVIVRFSPEFSREHPRLVSAFKKVAQSKGSQWSIADVGAKNIAATHVNCKESFREFLLKHLRKPKIAGLEWSSGFVGIKRWTTRYGTPAPMVKSPCFVSV